MYNQRGTGSERERKSMLKVILAILLFQDVDTTASDKGVPHSSVSKESACNAGYPGLIPRLGRSPGKGNGNPLQYSRLENPMDREAWLATVLGVTRFRHDLMTKPSHQINGNLSHF